MTDEERRHEVEEIEASLDLIACSLEDIVQSVTSIRRRLKILEKTPPE